MTLDLRSAIWSRGDALDPGQRVDNYVVRAQIGSGPHARSYAAVDSRSNQQIVLKIARPNDNAAAAVIDEGRFLQRLRNAAAPKLLGTGTFVGRPYLALAEERGVTLADVIRVTAPLPAASVAAILIRVSDAVKAAHDADVVHGDLSPGNALLRADGSVVLLDFGASREIGKKVAESDADRLATPGYAAPELYDPDLSLGPWTDIYAAGAIGYALLTGRTVRDSRRRGGDPLVNIALEHLPDGAALAEAIEHALRLEPAARPQSAEEWSAALGVAMPEAKEVDLAPMVEATLEALVPLPQDDHLPETEILTTGEIEHLISESNRIAERRAHDSAAGHGSNSAGWWLLGLMLVAVLSAGGWFAWRHVEWLSRTEWIVDAAGNGDFRSIGEAILAAPPRSLILIRAGTYGETIMLDRPLRLEARPAEDGDVVVTPKNGPCATIANPAGSITGIVFDGAGNGDDASCVEIIGRHARLESTAVRNWSGSGIRITGGSEAVIRNNDVNEGAAIGIAVDLGAKPRISENRVTGTVGPAIRVASGASPVIVGNRLKDSGGAAILLEGGAGGRIAGNAISGSAASAIEVRGGSVPIVEDNAIESAGGAGIFAYDGSRGKFKGNTISGSAFSGIIVDGGAAPDVLENVITDSREHGLLIGRGAGGEVVGNIVTDNGGHGIAVDLSSIAEIGENILENNLEPQFLKGRIEPK